MEVGFQNRSISLDKTSIGFLTALKFQYAFWDPFLADKLVHMTPPISTFRITCYKQI